MNINNKLIAAITANSGMGYHSVEPSYTIEPSTNQTSKFCYSSSKIKKIVASISFGVIAGAGIAIAATISLNFLSLSIVMAAAAISAIASVTLLHKTSKDNQTIGRITFDFWSTDDDAKESVKVHGEDIKVHDAFKKDLDRMTSLHIKTPNGILTVQKMFEKDFLEYKQVYASDDSAQEKEEANHQLIDSVFTQFVEHLVKQLGPDRKDSILPITEMFSQIPEVVTHSIIQQLGIKIISSRFGTKCEGLFFINHDSQTILEIPESGPAKIILEIKGNIKSFLPNSFVNSVDFDSHQPVSAKTTVTFGLNRQNHVDIEIDLTL